MVWVVCVCVYVEGGRMSGGGSLGWGITGVGCGVTGVGWGITGVGCGVMPLFMYLGVALLFSVATSLSSLSL